MKVKTLIRLLQKMDGERIVILQKDGEGNGFSPLCGADDNCKYVQETSWYGDVGIEKLTKQDIKSGHTEEDVEITKDGQKAVVLFPIN